MKYYFIFKESQDGTPTLIIYQEDIMAMFGSSPKVIKVFTGEKATQLFNELSEKAKEPKP